MKRNWLATATMIALLASLAPIAALGQDSGMGSVLVGETGSAEDLVLSEEETAAAMAALEGKTVGIVATTLETEYHSLLNGTAKSALEGLGATVNVCDSQVDAARALDCFEGFLQKGVAAIITTSSATTVDDAAKQAIADGIIVVQVTGLDLGETGAVGISVDNITIGLEEGRSAGAFAAETWPDQEVEAIILDFPDIPDLVARADAIEQGLAETNPNVKVVGRFLGGLPENGVTSIETALQQFPDLGLVTGINDGGNLGAYQALETDGKVPGEVAVFGIDCDPAAVALIDAGTIYEGCVDTNPAGTGELAASAIAKLLAGTDVPGNVEVPVSTYSGAVDAE
ncbi:MAG: sugar ABC transporter substrate-binding protein [Chloroflexota bacterium]